MIEISKHRALPVAGGLAVAGDVATGIKQGVKPLLHRQSSL